MQTAESRRQKASPSRFFLRRGWRHEVNSVNNGVNAVNFNRVNNVNRVTDVNHDQNLQDMEGLGFA